MTSPQRLIERGRFIVLGVVIVNLAVSFFVTVAAIASAQATPSGDRGGRFVITAILFAFLYIGHRWAKWATVALLALSGLIGLLMGVDALTKADAIGVLLTGIPVLHLASAALLVFPRSARAFLRAQHDRGILKHPRLARRVSAALGVLLILTLLILGFLAYFVESSGLDNVVRDGLGRPLSLSPSWVRLLLGAERLWPGWGWFIADAILFFGGMALGLRMITGGWEWSTD